MVVQKREWQAAQDPETAAKVGFFRADFDHGHPVKQVEGEHDLFGDGSVVCIPTHGHTPGHQSLRVRLPGGDVILASDACYLRRTLEALHLPSVLHDREMALATLYRLRALRDGGARIFYGHDPEFWATVPQGPDEVR
jgi:N-acyl homoserine lactone hydrolase